MKILTLVWQNMRRMFTRHFTTLFVLFLGLAVSATALCVYYAQSASMLNTLTAYTGTDRSLEFNVGIMQNPQTVGAIMDFCEREHETPVSVTVLSEENTEYDIVGILSDKPMYIHTEAGEWLPEEGGGILIPYQMVEKTAASAVGDEFVLRANAGPRAFRICGLYNGELYTPSQFSYARLDQADYVGAGVNTPDELPEDARPNRAVFVTLADFMDAGLSGNMLRVRFVSPLSKQQQASFADQLALYVAEQTGDSLSPNLALQESARQVFSADYYGKFMLYVLIVALSVCNVVTLYVFFLRRSRRRLLTYRYLGATGGRIFAATALEVLFYTLLAFTAGWLLKDVVIRLTPLKYTVPALGAGTYLLLFAAFAAVTLLMLGLFMRTLRTNGRSEREPLVSAGKLALRLRLRRVYLTLKSYSGGILTELILLMQVFFVAFSATYALTYIYERGGSERFIRRHCGGDNALYFTKSWQILEAMDSERLSIYENNNSITSAMDPVTPTRGEVIRLVKKLESLPGVRSVGLMNWPYMLPARGDPMFEIKETKHLHPMNVALSDGTTGWFLYEYSRGLCEDVSLPMKEGVWLTEWADGVDVRTSEFIPIVVRQEWCETFGYGLGDVIDTSMEYYFRCTVGCYDPYTDSFSDPDYAMRYNVRLKVVGVLPARAKIPLMQYSRPSLDNIFTNFDPNNPDTEYVYCPKLYVNGKPLQEDSLELTDALLFTDTPERIDEYNALLADYGEVWSIEALAQATDEMYADATPEYAVHTILAVLLLFVGVGGYNTLMLERQKRTLGVYFSCGMPWKRAAFVLLAGNALLFLIGGAGGALWGVYSANSLRPMMEDSKLYSILTGVALVAVLLAVSSAFTIWKMRRLSPVALMKKDDAD